MRDQRLDILAKVLVNYSTSIKKGDLVRISGEIPGVPLMEAVYEQVLLAGGHPTVQISTDNMADAFYRLASDEQLAYQSPLNDHLVEKIDASIGLWADENTKSQSNIDPKKQALASQARRPYMKRFMERAATKEIRWVGTQFPTNGSAQDAEMSLHEYADFVFRAGLLHLPDPIAAWKKVSESQQRLCDYLNGKKEVRVLGLDTDLTLAVEGRTWINCDGHENFPDGEVFTGPIETATEGTIRYSFPAVHHGREVHDIQLTFKAGKVVDAQASKGLDFLLKMLDQDPGARILGEFAIGTNFGIQQYTKNTLFDEKIGGTCHAAVGACYPETGAHNDSGLHWDMVCDLRAPGRKILVDGETILENGRFTNPEWPSP